MATRYLTALAAALALSGCGGGPTIINTFVNCPDGYAFAKRAAASQAEGSINGGNGSGIGASTVGCAPDVEAFPVE